MEREQISEISFGILGFYYSFLMLLVSLRSALGSIIVFAAAADRKLPEAAAGGINIIPTHMTCFTSSPSTRANKPTQRCKAA
jgi:hypothetical protein